MIKPIFFYTSRKFFDLYIIGLLVLVVGEIWMRYSDSTHGMQYAFDEELGHRYVPNQVSSSRVMGMFALEAPPIVINEEGYRNSVVDWNRPVILALGSSEVLGPGLAEEDIWTSRLTRLLRNGSEDDPLVYNAGIAGYGPFHASVVLRRFIERNKRPVLIIVRVSMGDRIFFPLTQDQLREEKANKEKRDFIKKYTLFIPLLYNKVQIQLDSIRSSLSLYRSKRVSEQSGDETDEAAGRMWEQNKEYWHKIASLSKKINIPVLFLVHNPYGAPDGEALFEIFKSNFSSQRCEFVSMLDRTHFGLFQEDLNERRRAFGEKYTLKYDPHANSLQHKVIADELFKYLNTANIPLNGKLSCS